MSTTITKSAHNICVNTSVKGDNALSFIKDTVIKTGVNNKKKLM